MQFLLNNCAKPSWNSSYSLTLQPWSTGEDERLTAVCAAVCAEDDKRVVTVAARSAALIVRCKAL